MRPRSVWYASAGAILALGAPAGLLILRELYTPRPVMTELLSDPLTYLYVLGSTSIVLATLGYIVGRQADRLAQLSETDVLTGLPNRRALTRRLAEEFRRSVRYGTPLSLMLVDVDGLKQVNDREGHAAGDRAIRHVADAIARGLRGTDFGARWGGDEFAVVLPSTRLEAAHASAERLVSRVRERSRDGRYSAGTVSIGIASFDPLRAAHTDVESLVRAADGALYRAKGSGRNRVQAA